MVNSVYEPERRHLHMESLPSELMERIPKLYHTRHEPDPVVWVRLFSPVFSWRWFIAEYEEVDGTAVFYGWISSSLEATGRFTQTDLASMRAFLGITIECDQNFTPCRLSEALCVEVGVQKFPLGDVVATPGALEALEVVGKRPPEFLARHSRGDWGELSEHDRLINEQALAHGGRLLSSYLLDNGQRLWIITEDDRSATTLLLPSEY
jgi:Protein of unknown function (DUF2958)